MKQILYFILAVIMIFSAGCGKTKVHKSMELVSRGAPAYSSDDCGGTKPADFANDGNYDNAWRSCKKPDDKNPAWLAYDLSKTDAVTILVAWYNEDTSPYDHTLIPAEGNPGYNLPGSYAIEVNKAPGGKLPEKGWETTAFIRKNTFHSRQHVMGFESYNWVRIVAFRPDGSTDNDGISLNMDVYDASGGTADDFLFIGDSITQMAMHHRNFECSLGKGTFSELINSKMPKYFPVQENAGTGYMKSSDGAKHIKRWVRMFPGKYVIIGYGTNDAWAKMNPEEFYANYETMVKTALAFGKTVLVPVSIPWSTKITEIQEHGKKLNAMLTKILNKYPEVIKGPDFWGYYKENENMLSDDGVHPSWPEGLFAYRKLWADLILKKIYKRK